MRARFLVAGVLLVLFASRAAGQGAAPPRAAADEPYHQALEESRRSEQAGELGTALAQLETLLRVGSDSVPATVRAEAVARMVSLEARLRQRLVARLFALVSSKTFWFAAALATLLGWRAWIRRYPRTDSTAVFFEDLTQPADARLEASIVLTRTILNQLQNPLPVHISTLQMDMLPGSEEPGFGGLQSALNVAPIDGFKVADQPMKVAGIEFSVRALVMMLSRFLARPHAANLTGWLNDSADGVAAYAALTDRYDPRKNTTWRIESTGTGARASAIADLAAQILVDTGNSTLTHDWKSLRCFREAIKLRQGSARPGLANLALARDYLEDAVTYDSSNWIARFNLALTLSRAGEPEVALKHFELLEGVVRRAWRSNLHPEESCSGAPAFVDVKRHLDEYPECLFLILYNKAMALAALHDPERNAQAMRELERLAGLRHDDGWQAFGEPHDQIARKLDPRARVELSLYALGAQTAVLAGQSDIHRHDSVRSREVAARVEALLSEIETLCANTQDQHWRSLQTARAVALAAGARAGVAQGRTALARERLDAAIAAEPRFLEAYLLLAELYLEYTVGCARDWEQRAEMLLKRVLELNPECTRAMLLLTRLPARPPFTHPARARPAPA